MTEVFIANEYIKELFLPRYNCERLNNALKRVKKFANWREPIVEAYFPKLDSLTSSRGWPPRQSGMTWRDLNRPVDGLAIKVSDMEVWRRNIDEAISTGMVRLVSSQVLRLYRTVGIFFIIVPTYLKLF